MRDGAKYGKMDGSVIVSDTTIEFFYSEVMNPYSWSISYFDDWRCIVDYLRKADA